MREGIVSHSVETYLTVRGGTGRILPWTDGDHGQCYDDCHQYIPCLKLPLCAFSCEVANLWKGALPSVCLLYLWLLGLSNGTTWGTEHPEDTIHLLHGISWAWNFFARGLMGGQFTPVTSYLDVCGFKGRCSSGPSVNTLWNNDGCKPGWTMINEFPFYAVFPKRDKVRCPKNLILKNSPMIAWRHLNPPLLESKLSPLLHCE